MKKKRDTSHLLLIIVILAIILLIGILLFMQFKSPYAVLASNSKASAQGIAGAQTATTTTKTTPVCDPQKYDQAATACNNNFLSQYKNNAGQAQANWLSCVGAANTQYYALCKK